MHLLAPWWWWLFVPLAGGLILLYLLKLKRRDYVVPSVYLWEQALQDLQANAPLQKLRVTPLLLLQLLVFLIAVAALTRPAMEWRRTNGRSMVLILDASASMQSTDVAPSRFAVAKREAHRLVEALGAQDRMMVVAIGGLTRALTSFTSDTRALHTAIDRLAVTDGRADLRGALDIASGLGSDAHGGRPSVVLISDAAIPAVPMANTFQLPFHLVVVGRRNENVGIVMMNVRRRVSGREGTEGLIALKNFSDGAKVFTLELYVDDQLLDAREIEMPAKSDRTEVLRALPETGGLLRAQLDIKDDLAVDNRAQLILPKIDPLPVALVSSGNLFLETALTLDPTLTVTAHATVPETPAPRTVLIVDNVPVTRVPDGVSALLIGEIGAGIPGKLRFDVSEPVIADWDRRHPVLAHVDVSRLHLSSASLLTPRADAQVLIETNAGPIALAVDRQGQRIVYLGWDLHRSDFVVQPSFPIFIANCLNWLSGDRQRAQVQNARTGELVTVALPTDSDTVTLVSPDGARERLTATGAHLVIDRFTRAGLYRLTGKKLDIAFSVNLLDVNESNLMPQQTLALGGATVKGGGSSVRTEQEFWRELLLLVLVLLCVEWWVFHRRIG